MKGPYPPYIGGVSIHTLHLADRLFAEGFLNKIYSTTSLSGFNGSSNDLIGVYYPKLRYGPFQSLYWFIKYGIKDRSNIYHLHLHPIWESPSLFLMLLLKKHIVYTVHDQMMLANLELYPKILLILFKHIAKHRNIHWIVVNETIKEQLNKISPFCKNVTVIPAFIPSILINSPLNEEIEIFIKSKSPIISVYAHSTRLFEGKDLYGIDLAIKSLVAVRAVFPDIGLIISIPGEIDQNQINAYLDIINKLQLSASILLFLKPVNNPLNLWKRSNIVLRPTLTDGDSLVIREALAQSTYVVASDIAFRPEGTILFKSEDIHDLSMKIIFTLNSSEFKPPLSAATDNYKLIKKIYNSFD